jgi:malonate decarboxylase alpha subunit
MRAVKPWMSGPVLPTDKTVEALEALVVAEDRIVVEGDNQKQADFLSRSLVPVAGRATVCRWVVAWFGHLHSRSK